MKRKGLLICGGDSNDRDDRAKNDFYTTPKIAIDKLMQKERFLCNIFEPCAGNGAISKVLEKDYGMTVVSNDIIDYGYDLDYQEDILKLTKEQVDRYYFGGSNFDIITNPPYCLAEECIKKFIELVNDNCKVACLLRIQFLESISRYENIFKNGCLKNVYVFSKRVNCPRDDSEEQAKKSSCICFAWFVFEKGYKGKPTLDWVNNGE